MPAPESITLVPHPDQVYPLGVLVLPLLGAGLYRCYWQLQRLGGEEWIHARFDPPTPPALLGALALVAAWCVSQRFVRVVVERAGPRAIARHGFAPTRRRTLGSLAGAEQVVALKHAGFSGHTKAARAVDVVVETPAGRVPIGHWPLPGRGLDDARRLAAFLGVPYVERELD